MTGRDKHIGGQLKSGGECIAIIAGGGKVPVQLARYLRDNGQSPYVVMIAGEADQTLTEFDHAQVKIAALGKLIALIKRQKINRVVIIGSVRNRPKLTDIRPNLSTFKFIRRFLSGLIGGDSELLSKVVATIEEFGIKVVGAHEIMPELLTPDGQIAGPKPTKAQAITIARGMEAATLLGTIDAGQCCVVIGRNIVALEGVEGTDAMLERVADQKRHGRLTNARGGVLIKMCKPQQDKRVDLPAIGVSTIKNAQNAKLDGIAIHANNSMIVDVQDVIAQAGKTGMFIVGVDAGYSSEANV